MPGSTTTRREIRRALYDYIPQLGFSSTADSVGGSSNEAITDVFTLKDSNLSANQFKGAYIYRPNLTNEDRLRKAGNLNTETGVLYMTGAAYSNTSDLEYEIVGLLHPDELNACIQRALRDIYFETQVPLTLVEDGDMGKGDTTSWSVVADSASKVISGAEVFSGLRALKVINGYVQSKPILVNGGEPFYVAAIVRSPTSGPFRLAVIDTATDSEIGNSPSSSSSNWVHIWQQGTLPNSCREVAVRLIGSGATVLWDNVIFYRLYDRRVIAPDWLNEPWKFLKLRRARYERNISHQEQDANSRTFEDYYQPRDFSLDPFHPEANAYAIQLMRPIPTGDLWIEAKRPFYDLEKLSEDTDTTTAPFLQVMAHVKLELAQLLVKRYPQDPKWTSLLAEASMETRAETHSRPEIPYQPVKRDNRSRI